MTSTIAPYHNSEDSAVSLDTNEITESTQPTAKAVQFLDCTLRDGGYYTSWDFSKDLIQRYFIAVARAGVTAVEVGFRSISNKGFKGACAYTTEDFLESLIIPAPLAIGVMINGKEIANIRTQSDVIKQLFPQPAKSSRVSLVRVACHYHEFASALMAADQLKEMGFQVGFNLMQIAERTQEEVVHLAKMAADSPIDVLYFADSMGGMQPDDVERVIGWLRESWTGEIGIHTHDNLGLALSNCMRALDSGASWVDSTVTGMGRGPGNARTEELAIEISARSGQKLDMVPMMEILRRDFKPLQQQYGWGTNPYYYLSGKHGIHPSYVQEMLGDSRYTEEDVLAVLTHLMEDGGSHFEPRRIQDARLFYSGSPRGTWAPSSVLNDKIVLLVGAGPGVKRHREAIERLIKREQPVVIALNTQQSLEESFIDYRIACHPVRLLADASTHAHLPHPLITPVSMLPTDVTQEFGDKELLDFGLSVDGGSFDFQLHHCTVPSSMVVAYALAMASSGSASKVWLAGFDGYGPGDPRTEEMSAVFDQYIDTKGHVPVMAITPTEYSIPTLSVYAI